MTSDNLQELLYSEGALEHCNMTIKPYEIWYLYDIDGFNQRKLRLGKCPKCKCNVIELEETRIEDEKVFKSESSKDTATHIINLNVNNVRYSSLDVVAKKRVTVTTPRTICYGKTTEFYGKNKELTSIRCSSFNFFDKKTRAVKISKKKK